MASDENSDQLETNQVFIDTQAYHRERYDWQSKSCSRLKELGKSGQLQVLTTSVTRSEVRSKIRESLVNARSAMQRHDVVLGQLEKSSAITALEAETADTKLQALFDEYMRDVRAVEVPLSKNVEKIFDDYFHERPPFSAKKKSEFPDAFVVSSLQERAQKLGSKIYIVSGDSDLRACCSHAPELLIVDGLSEIISRATVTKAVHDGLLSFLKDSSELEAELTQCLKSAEIVLRGASRTYSRSYVRFHVMSSGVQAIDEINVAHLHVISRRGNQFSCLLDFEAFADVWLEIGKEIKLWDGEEEHESFEEFSTMLQHPGMYTAELEVQFDLNSPEKASLGSVSCGTEMIIDPNEIDELERQFRSS